MQYGITVLAGLGILYAGLRLLAYSFRRLASRRLDDGVRWGVGSIPTAWLAGLAVGAVARNAGTVTLTAGALLSTDRVAPTRVLALMCGAAIGTAFLVFLVPLHIYAMVAGAVVVAGILFLLDTRHADQMQFAGAAVLAAAIIFVGIVTARSGGYSLAADPEASAWLAGVTVSPWIGLLVGVVLGAATVSAWHAAILVIVLATPGVLAPTTIAFALAGGLAGAALAEIVVVGRLGDTARHLVGLQLMPRLAAAVIAVAALLVAGDTVRLQSDNDLAILYLALQVLTGVCLLAWIGPRPSALAGRLPDDDALTAPRYLFDVDAVDPDSALDLIRREQDRIVPLLCRVVESALPENRATGTARAEATTRSIVGLGKAIDTFTTDLIDRSHERRPVAAATRLMVRTNALMELNGALSEFAALSHIAAASPGIAPIVDAMSESLHALVTAVGESLGERTGDELALAKALTDNRSGILRQLREKVTRSDDRTAAEDFGLIYQMTGVLERSVWLLRHLVDDEVARAIALAPPAPQEAA